jgi:prephenate dehydrogenase
VIGVGRNAARLKKAKSLGAIDEFTTDLAAGVRDADVVALAVPVADIVALGRRVRPHVKPGAFVTDLGSVKGPVARAFAGWPHFVGAHPMCGSEKTGVENARADLYRGASCVLTPSAKTSPRAAAAAAAFWREAGAEVLRLSPEEHDRRAALVSHLPHLIAEALVWTAGREKSAVRSMAAGSFKDATRVAGADPALWASIFDMNRAAVREAARGFERALRELLKEGPSARMLERVRRLRDDLNRGKNS